jgi:hypothetical protein
MIRAFSAADDTFQLEQPVASIETTSTGPTGAPTAYEIHTIWNADEIHAAINEALLLAGRSFPETLYDTTQVMITDKMNYSLTGLTRKVWILSHVWIERSSEVTNGNVVSATPTTAVIPAMPTGVSTNWRINIYEGTGAGQTRQIVSVLGNEATVSTWTTTPDTTSRFALYDTSEARWQQFKEFRVDAGEFPDYIYLSGKYPGYAGMRFRYEFLSVPAELTTDTDTTTVPKAYIKAKACSILHGMALSGTKSDKEMHYAEYVRYRDESDAYVVRNAYHSPGTVFSTPIESVLGPTDWDDPLGWK